MSSHQMPPIFDCYVFVVAYYRDFTNKCLTAGGEGILHFTNKYPMGDTSFYQQAPTADGEGTLDFTNKYPVGDT